MFGRQKVLRFSVLNLLFAFPTHTKTEVPVRPPFWKGRRTQRTCSFRGAYANRGTGMELSSSDVGGGCRIRTRVDITALTVFKFRTHFRVYWKIRDFSTLFETAAKLGKTRIVRQLDPQSRMESSKKRLQERTPKIWRKNGQMERIWRERREK